jgi:hypothetical protein
VAYCAGAAARAEVRRDAVNRAYAAHKRAVQRGDDAYPPALVLAQRLGVALEDLARLALALRTLRTGQDAFVALRDASFDEMTEVYAELARDAEALRSCLHLPSADTTDDLEPEARAALLEAGEAIARRWHGQWQRAASGWLLLRRLAKAMRHGSPLLPRELVIDPPGAGRLGAGLGDLYARWVLLVDTTVDDAAREHRTEYGSADISDATLRQARQGGLDAISLTKDLAEGHWHRMLTQSRWAIPRDALRYLTREQRSILERDERT